VPRLTDIWTGVLLVGLGVFVGALLLLMLFEAEGPVWAIAKLSFKEAVRSQVLWIFLIGVLPFLFPLQWLSSGNIKASDELRLVTSVVTVVLSLLTLIPALLIASFGIPNDIKNLNIYTVVSKPVVRFEIVLGRFVGYVALMTLVMAALTGVSLVLVVNSSMSEKARAETYTARVPFRGKMELKSIVGSERTEKKEFEGINVGREFDYRRYVQGHGESPQRIIWRFYDLPADMQHPRDDRIPVEFTFDIFKLTKGEQNRGVLTKFQFATHNCPLRQPRKGEVEWEWADAAAKINYDRRVEEFKAKGIDPTRQDVARPGTPAWEALNQLTEEFGYYEIKGKEVFDYQVMSVQIPAGLVRNAMKGEAKDERGNPLPRLSAYVKCESEGQMLGAAEPDLYLLRAEMPYSLNFLKASVGLWCRLCIIIGVAVALSTYLSGILSLLVTALIFGTGFFTDHLSDLANNRNVGGGPFQSMSQVVRAEQPTTQLSDSAGTRALLYGDKGVAWVVRRVQNMIPDVESFSWGNFVAEGFNVNGEYLVVNLLVTLGYLLPWAVFAYYLMKSREVAA
jgi:ABC-type transport system involved in multi-copper enzyme maturation permease subunit